MYSILSIHFVEELSQEPLAKQKEFICMWKACPNVRRHYNFKTNAYLYFLLFNLLISGYNAWGSKLKPSQ